MILLRFLGATLVLALGWESINLGIKMMNWPSDLAYYGGILLCIVALAVTYKVEKVIVTFHMKPKGETNAQKLADNAVKSDVTN